MLLVVDTALAHAQAALVADGAVVGASFAAAEGDAEAVVQHAEAALAAAGAGWGDVTGVATTVGPGSFTGVRVGIAFAKGVAFARAVPVTGTTTLEAIAAMAGGTALCVVDARHGAVFAALVRDGAVATMGRMAAEQAAALAQPGVPVAGPAAAIAALGGREIAALGGRGIAALGGRGIVVDRLDPLAVASACAVRALPPSAVYLAPVDAAPQRHKALARASL